MPRAVRGMCTLLLSSLAAELTCVSDRSPDRMWSVRESHYPEVRWRKTWLHCGGPGWWPPPGYQREPTAEPEDPAGKGMSQKTAGLATILTTTRRNSMKRSCNPMSRNPMNEFPGCFDIFPSYHTHTYAILSSLRSEGTRRVRSIVQRQCDSSTTTNGWKRASPHVEIMGCHVYSLCNWPMTRPGQQRWYPREVWSREVAKMGSVLLIVLSKIGIKREAEELQGLPLARDVTRLLTD